MKLRLLLCLSLAVVMAGCGSGTPVTPLTEEEVTQNITSAKSFLESGDISSAYEAYVEIIAGGGSSNSEARFGKAFTEFLLIMESEEAGILLSAFNESPLTYNIFFTKDGYFHTKYRGALPFYGLRDCTKYFRSHIQGRCLLSAMKDDYTYAEFSNKLLQIDPYLAEVEEDLALAKVDGFTFVIPKQLFNSKEDITIDKNDVALTLASIISARSAIALAASWSFDLKSGAIFDMKGLFKMSKGDIVDGLNSSFVLLPSNHLVDAKAHLDRAILESISVLEEKLGDSETGALWELEQLILAGKEMLKGPYVVPFTTPVVELDMSKFFIDPPDASKIPYDPFVLEGTKIKFVEAFWSEMLNNAVGANVDYFRGVKFTLTKLKHLNNITNELKD